MMKHELCLVLSAFTSRPTSVTDLSIILLKTTAQIKIIWSLHEMYIYTTLS